MLYKHFFHPQCRKLFIYKRTNEWHVRGKLSEFPAIYEKCLNPSVAILKKNGAKILDSFDSGCQAHNRNCPDRNDVEIDTGVND